MDTWLSYASGISLDAEAPWSQTQVTFEVSRKQSNLTDVPFCESGGGFKCYNKEVPFRTEALSEQSVHGYGIQRQVRRIGERRELSHSEWENQVSGLLSFGR